MPTRKAGHAATKAVRVKDDRPVRAVTLPVGAPVGRSWEELNAALADCFRLSTGLANWCVHRLFAADTPGEPRTPAAVRGWYGYGDAGENYPAWGAWSGAMASAQCVIRAVHRKYVQTRFDVMVRNVQSHLTYRFPFPFPVHNRDWKTGYADGGFPTVTITLPLSEELRGQFQPLFVARFEREHRRSPTAKELAAFDYGRFQLRLKRRADFGRQLAMFRQLHEGAAGRGEAALYRNRKGDVLVKLVGRFPRREPGPRGHVCFLHTDPAAFLVAEVDGRSPWVLNADHLRRRQAAHASYRQRAAEDAKREKRMDRRQRYHLDKSRDLRCAKHRDRLDTAVKQVAAQVARFCERQGVALVAYDDSVSSYLPDGFPWHALKTRLQVLLGEAGVGWVCGGYVSLSTEERGKWVELARATATAGRRAVANSRRAGPHPKVSTSRRPTTRRGSAR